jgi:hypothetical protein
MSSSIATAALVTTSVLFTLACSAESPQAEKPGLTATPTKATFTLAPLGANLPAWALGPKSAGVFSPTAIAEVKGGGLGLIDFDRDGLLDVFVPGSQVIAKPQSAPGAKLFRNLGDCAFELVQESGIDWIGWGMGVAIGDLNGDGYDDIFTAALGANAAHFNRGAESEPHFEERAGKSGLADERWGMAAALGDLDNDGDLDLYIANYLDLNLDDLPPDTTYLGESIFAGPLGLTPTPDQLLRNNGDGTFQDKTFRSGIGAVKPAFGLGATVLDFNEDGLLDIFVGNDSMANSLFQNLGGFAFEDRATMMGLAANGDGREQATMGIAISDVTGDGLPDLFSTNFASDSNTLLVAHKRSSGAIGFRDKSAQSGAATGSRSLVGWASIFGDFNLDGDQDLVVFNGHVYPERLAAKMGSTSPQPLLYYAQEGGRFKLQAAAESGAWLQYLGLFRGAVRGDLDNDGDLDLAFTELTSGAAVLRNDSARGTRESLAVILIQDTGDRRGLGSRIVLSEGGKTQTQWVQPSMGFQGSGTCAVHFALSPGDFERTLEITWPNGDVQIEQLDGRKEHLEIRREL